MTPPPNGAPTTRRDGSSPNWGWCLKIGLVVVAVDLLVLLLAQGQEQSDVSAFLDSLDQVANVLLFAYAGYRTGRETGRATAAAEAGVVASVLPAIVAALYQIIQPVPPPGDLAVPLASRVVGSVAFNIVLGGISAWFSGWIASRAPGPARR